MLTKVVAMFCCAAALAVYAQTDGEKRVMAQLQKENICTGEEKGLRLQVREMLANGSGEQKALSMIRTCAKNGVTGDEIGATLVIANRAMLAGAKAGDIEKDVALAAKERDQERTREQTRTRTKDGSGEAAYENTFSYRFMKAVESRLEKMDSKKAKDTAQQLRQESQERRQAQGENKKSGGNTAAGTPGGRR
ncbi:MAG: hypothetical protein HZC28_00130 [Spirochaetes bacterium]|nr:hypothetical protein [Spirochaetota bacterium]